MITIHPSKTRALAAAVAIVALAMAPVSVFAGERRGESDNAAEQEQIRPVPGQKACLHHIAQYDEEGNFVGYKTERGPCR